MATTAAEKTRREEQKKLYAATVALPAEQSRALAVEQQSRLAERLRQGKDKLGAVLGRWKQYDEDLSAIAQHLTWGDELRDKSDEESRKARRQQYARAYVRGRTAAANLDTELADRSTYQVVFRDVVTKTAEVTTKAVDTVEKAAEKTAETLEKVSEGVSTGLWLSLGGVIAALLVYANQKGKR